jgi:predicted GNAT family acetyltransferase
MAYTIARVHVKRPTDPAAFLAEAEPFLLADEARANLVLGIAGTLRDEPEVYADFDLWLVEGDSGVAAAALRTPPHNLVLLGDPDAAEVLAEALVDEGVDLPGVTGNRPEVERFVARWEARTGSQAVALMQQRIYALERLRWHEDVPGRAREATETDRALLIELIQAFADESLRDSPTTVDVERTVDLRLRGDRGGYVLWEDPGAVSLAGWGGPTPNGIRIGPVYTPPEHRRRGYGGAVTAAASARNLERGRRFCFLYTDLANPTSNKIYMDIGYEPVADSAQYRFE